QMPVISVVISAHAMALIMMHPVVLERGQLR
ncbi:hypothetical protein GCK32_021393, partial [Trichostrongylus colubriformis]